MLGFFLTAIILEIGLRFGGFVILSLQEHQNRVSIQRKGTYRIMCLGESTTAGVYPYLLEEVLNQRNVGIKFSVIDKGVSGTNTMAILTHLEENLDRYNPDMVITMMGINDAGLRMSYEVVSDSKAINFLKSFRIYKLTRLIWLHAATKLKELKSNKNNVNLKLLFQVDGLRQVYAGEKAIELNPKNDNAYIELGWVYRDQGKLSEAELLLKKAIELNPKNDNAYIELGWFYRDQGKLSEAELLLKKAIELNPKNYRAYVVLGWFYRDQGKLSEAELLLKKAIELNPKSDRVYVELGKVYRDQGKLFEAELLLKKAIELNPKSDRVYVELGWVYRDQGKLSEAELLLKKAIELDSKNDRAYGELKVLYGEMGNSRLAREYDKKVDKLRLNYYFAMTVSNYHKLKAVLDKRGIVYVCVQYPMRSLESLKKIFQGNAKGIIFVDNQRIFEDALKQGNYRDYFEDSFGGDFGHCAPEGNKILAENIANVILKEVFGK